MKIDTAAALFFSPTGTTKKLLLTIAQGMGITCPKLIDLTTPRARKASLEPLLEDVVLIGIPVYEERIPKIVKSKMEELQGNGKPVVLVAVYGNIGYGLALKELLELADKCNLRAVAAGAFIGEHSFSSQNLPVAAGRPDKADLEKALAFGCKVREKLASSDTPDVFERLSVPGYLPLMARLLPENSARLFTANPKITSGSCNRCGVCSKLCPSGAIDPISFSIDTKLCLRCFACVRRCPHKARQIRYKKQFLVNRFLGRQGSKRKEPTIFI